MDNINSTKTPKWSLYKIEPFINNKKNQKVQKIYLISQDQDFIPLRLLLARVLNIHLIKIIIIIQILKRHFIRKKKESPRSYNILSKYSL